MDHCCPARGLGRAAGRTALGLLVLLGGTGSAAGAATQTQPTPAEDKKEQDVSFLTSDGVRIYGTYYESSAGEESEAVICLHALGRDRRDFITLARKLQAAGIAVLTLDLRGHGQSVTVDPELYAEQWKRGMQRLSRRQPTLDRSKFRKADYRRMIRDVEAGKRFLIRQNNRQKLNVRKLALIGAEFGCTLALGHADYDWRWPPNQGRDVQALVLLSPRLNAKGISIIDEATYLADKIPVLTIVGTRDKESFPEAKRIARITMQFRDRGGPKSFLQKVDTLLSGTKLLEPEFRLADAVIEWIKVRIADSQPPPWSERKPPAYAAGSGY